VKPGANWGEVMTGKKNLLQEVSAKYEPPTRLDSLAEFQQKFSKAWRREKNKEPLPAEEIELGNEVDGITAATISSRAVVKAVNKAVQRIKAIIPPKARSRKEETGTPWPVPDAATRSANASSRRS